MSPSNLEVAKELYRAINLGDTEAALKLFDPQIIRVEFEGTPSGGTYRGLTELGAHLNQGRSTWAEGSCTPEEIISTHDKLVVLVHVHVRLKSETEWIDGRVADGFALRNGKITEFHSFMENAAAFKWADVSL